MTVERQVVTALGSIGTATLASRVLGFVRDMIVALIFGAGPVTGVVPFLLVGGLGAVPWGPLNPAGPFFAAGSGPRGVELGLDRRGVGLGQAGGASLLGLALGLLAGGVGQFLVQVPSLRRCGLLVGPSAELDHPALGRVVRLLLPAVFGLAAVQVSVFVNTLLASLLPPGSISFLSYADRVMEFPLGVFGIALASASLPAMARQAAAGDTRGVAATLNFALRLGLYIAVPATVGLVILRTPIIRVLFERGQFGPSDTLATAQALAWYAVGLVGFSGARIAAQAFYAVGEAATAVRLGLLSVAANVPAALVLMGPLAHGAPRPARPGR